MSNQLQYSTVNVFTPQAAPKTGGVPITIIHLPIGFSLTHLQKSRLARTSTSKETVFLHASHISDPTTPEATRTIETYTLAGNPIPFSAGSALAVSNYLYRSETPPLTLLTQAGPVQTFRTPSGAGIRLPTTIPTALKINDSCASISTTLHELHPLSNPTVHARINLPNGMTFVMAQVPDTAALSLLQPFSALPELPAAKEPAYVGTFFYVLGEAVEPGRFGTRRTVTARMLYGDREEDISTPAAACALAAFLKIREKVPGISIKQ